ncbi:hypothetical protein HDV05_006164 [Chytridiales sp. JEL 0842]|nr:hypothetical protein HDV05_006164 [Chytridiales sp. JEL 0842]
MSELAELADPSGRFSRFAQCLGQGAYKRVYKAFDEEEGVEVAWNQLRVDHLNKKDISRVLTEIKILQSLRNENIINFFYSWAKKGADAKETVIFITELMTSGTLKSYIRKTKGPIKPKVLKNWSRQILSGLQYLHTLNPPIIHRDLKCENIFINGNNSQAKIGDLGLAVVKSKSHVSSVLGTPEFMAPELYDEQYDEKVDIYAFGMVVLEIVTKEYPYSECTNQAQIYKKVTMGVRPKALEKVTDPETKSFIELCIDFNPANRPSACQLLKCEFLNSTNVRPITSNNTDASASNQPATLQIDTQAIDNIARAAEESTFKKEAELVSQALRLPANAANENSDIQVKGPISPTSASAPIDIPMVKKGGLPVIVTSALGNHLNSTTCLKSPLELKGRPVLVTSRVPLTPTSSSPKKASSLSPSLSNKSQTESPKSEVPTASPADSAESDAQKADAESVMASSVSSYSSSMSYTSHSQSSSVNGNHNTIRVDFVDRVSSDVIVLRMVYAPSDSASLPQEIQFPFNLPEDTATDVVSEMVKENLINAEDEVLARRRLEEKVRSVLLGKVRASVKRRQMLEQQNHVGQDGGQKSDIATVAAPVYGVRNALGVVLEADIDEEEPALSLVEEDPRLKGWLESKNQSLTFRNEMSSPCSTNSCESPRNAAMLAQIGTGSTPPSANQSPVLSHRQRVPSADDIFMISASSPRATPAATSMSAASSPVQIPGALSRGNLGLSDITDMPAALRTIPDVSLPGSPSQSNHPYSSRILSPFTYSPNHKRAVSASGMAMSASNSPPVPTLNGNAFMAHQHQQQNFGCRTYTPTMENVLNVATNSLSVPHIATPNLSPYTVASPASAASSISPYMQQQQQYLQQPYATGMMQPASMPQVSSSFNNSASFQPSYVPGVSGSSVFSLESYTSSDLDSQPASTTSQMGQGIELPTGNGTFPRMKRLSDATSMSNGFGDVTYQPFLSLRRRSTPNGPMALHHRGSQSSLDGAVGSSGLSNSWHSDGAFGSVPTSSSPSMAATSVSSSRTSSVDASFSQQLSAVANFSMNAYDASSVQNGFSQQQQQQQHQASHQLGYMSSSKSYSPMQSSGLSGQVTSTAPKPIGGMATAFPNVRPAVAQLPSSVQQKLQELEQRNLGDFGSMKKASQVPMHQPVAQRKLSSAGLPNQDWSMFTTSAPSLQSNATPSLI